MTKCVCPQLSQPQEKCIGDGGGTHHPQWLATKFARHALEPGSKEVPFNTLVPFVQPIPSLSSLLPGPEPPCSLLATTLPFPGDSSPKVS